MKIKSVHLNNLRNDGHFQFLQFLIALVQSIGAAVPKVEKQFADLVALHTQEDEMFGLPDKGAPLPFHTFARKCPKTSIFVPNIKQ